MTNVVPLPTPEPAAEERPVLVLDCGGQYSQLIARRVRECRVYSELVSHSISPSEVRRRDPLALVLSGGPASVYAENAPRVDPRLLDTVLVRIAGAAEKMLQAKLVPVILCTPELRRPLRNLCERAAPRLRVISLAEIAPGFELRVFASVSAAAPAGRAPSTSDQASPALRPAP